MFKSNNNPTETQIESYIEKMDENEKKQLLKALEAQAAYREAAKLNKGVKGGRVTMAEIVKVVRKIRSRNHAQAR